MDTLMSLHLANLPCEPTTTMASVRQGMPVSPSDGLAEEERQLSLDWVVPASRAIPTRRVFPRRKGLCHPRAGAELACVSFSLASSPGLHLASR